MRFVSKTAPAASTPPTRRTMAWRSASDCRDDGFRGSHPRPSSVTLPDTLFPPRDQRSTHCPVTTAPATPSPIHDGMPPLASRCSLPVADGVWSFASGRQRRIADEAGPEWSSTWSASARCTPLHWRTPPRPAPPDDQFWPNRSSADRRPPMSETATCRTSSTGAARSAMTTTSSYQLGAGDRGSARHPHRRRCARRSHSSTTEMRPPNGRQVTTPTSMKKAGETLKEQTQKKEAGHLQAADLLTTSSSRDPSAAGPPVGPLRRSGGTGEFGSEALHAYSSSIGARWSRSRCSACSSSPARSRSSPLASVSARGDR